MDYLKLLTRSAKSQNVTNTQKRVVPSTVAEQPSVKQPPSANIHSSTPHGRKRKRSGSDAPKQGAQNGLQDQDAARHGHKATTELLSSFSGSRPLTNAGVELPDPMTPDECKRTYRKHKIKVHTMCADDGEGHKLKETFPQPLMSFSLLRQRFSVSRRLFENVQKQRYEVPTEIQMSSLPLLLSAIQTQSLQSSRPDQQPRVNLLAVAPTGSGKTLAFLIPTIQTLLDQDHQRRDGLSQHEVKGNSVRAVILAPSHELVEQIVNEGKKLAQGTGIRISGLKKGMRLPSADGVSQDQKADSNVQEPPHDVTLKASHVKSDIIVSTPPLLLNAIEKSGSSLHSINLLIFDEADILLGDLFHDQTIAIWNECTSPALQTSLWSATISSSIESLTTAHIVDRRERLGKSLGLADQQIFRIIVGTKDSSIPNIDHRLVFTATEQGKLLALRQLLAPSTSSVDNLPSLQPPFLVFTQTISRAVALHSELLYDVPPEAGGSSRIAVLHSELSETARSEIMAGVRKGEIWILITTDLLSRGIDFKGMNGVVSYDIPNTSASYVHRAGRTGRQGRDGGVAITLYTKEDIPYVKNVANVIAASEKARASKGKADQLNDRQMQDWLLNSLPDISKKTRQKLKHGGIEHRKTSVVEKDPRKARSMRISTKSGYDRKLENRRKGAASRNRSLQHNTEGSDHEADKDDWEGFG